MRTVAFECVSYCFDSRETADLFTTVVVDACVAAVLMLMLVLFVLPIL